MEIQTLVQLTHRPARPGLPRWRFVLPLLFQVALVLTVPMPKVAAYVGGTTATLEVAPVDPYDPLRGRYVRLDYPLTRLETLRRLEGWTEAWSDTRPTLYLTLLPQGAEQGLKPTAIAAQPPEVPPGTVVLAGRLEPEGLQLGLGEYHLPEGLGDEAEARMQQFPGASRAEVRVDGQGRAVLTGLWIAGKRY